MTDQLRTPLERFALLMEQRLQENDDKEGWDGIPVGELIVRALGEIGELMRACGARGRGWRAARFEAADAANYLMMIGDQLEAEGDAGGERGVGG